jgi:hypothetical protein
MMMSDSSQLEYLIILLIQYLNLYDDEAVDEVVEVDDEAVDDHLTIIKIQSRLQLKKGNIELLLIQVKILINLNYKNHLLLNCFKM